MRILAGIISFVRTSFHVSMHQFFSMPPSQPPYGRRLGHASMSFLCAPVRKHSLQHRSEASFVACGLVVWLRSASAGLCWQWSITGGRDSHCFRVRHHRSTCFHDVQLPSAGICVIRSPELESSHTFSVLFHGNLSSLRSYDCSNGAGQLCLRDSCFHFSFMVI
jgi:hypothetical protein